MHSARPARGNHHRQGVRLSPAKGGKHHRPSVNKYELKCLRLLTQIRCACSVSKSAR
ncbi:hypothetical protein SPHINGO391_410098 [Sphingomonas aurantiaca]|uniref:Uncharacterized protein n=1 Tax=Sphingomonas aurantiaca TaxID=185949 RepID=A0A5E7Z548_9SPHN|nr:hypothetical protein SPHINGO391_410098 [Sphingomonas aurantiaca]